MNRMVGTTSRGIRAPIIKTGDPLPEIVVESVLKAAKSEGFSINDRDVIAVTEAVVARAQGNYAHIDHIAKDVSAKFGDNTVGVVFPILSRNRFAVCLKGIAKGCKEVVLMLSYPSDEVGNSLLDADLLDEKNVNPWIDVLTEAEFREIFGYPLHIFTGVDYIDYYKSLIEEAGAKATVIFANNPKAILPYTKHVLACDVHSRAKTKAALQKAGAELVLGLEDLMNESIDGSGYNPTYGLLGSNKATEETVKLFPIHCDRIVDKIQAGILEKTGKRVEVMVYGDGAFKDPIGKIWELADPVVSPAYTPGLEGTPNELKLKYLADNEYADLSGEALCKAIQERIRKKDTEGDDLTGRMETQGTTPRRLPDLLGSLADLTSGSGDKGTPFILIQGYFDNFTAE